MNIVCPICRGDQDMVDQNKDTKRFVFYVIPFDHYWGFHVVSWGFNYILITSTYWAYYIHEFYRLYCVYQCNYFFRLSWCWVYLLAIIISKSIRKTYTSDIDLPYVADNNINRIFCISLVHCICVIKVWWLYP